MSSPNNHVTKKKKNPQIFLELIIVTAEILEYYLRSLLFKITIVMRPAVGFVI